MEAKVKSSETTEIELEQEIEKLQSENTNLKDSLENKEACKDTHERDQQEEIIEKLKNNMTIQANELDQVKQQVLEKQLLAQEMQAFKQQLEQQSNDQQERYIKIHLERDSLLETKSKLEEELKSLQDKAVSNQSEQANVTLNQYD